MHFLGNLIEILDTDMKEPELYGWFHLLFFALSIAVGILFCKLDRSGNEKFARKMIFLVSFTVLVLEVYKQFNYSFSYDGQSITADYQWYAFPFQFCSTPMYAGLLAALIKNKKVHDALCAYLATFSVFAGLCVMLYPADVFIDTVGINIQTMICHGAMLSVGIYLLYTDYVKNEHKTILKAIPVFAAFIILAMIMNEVAYFSGLLERETFNMFFISPHCEGTLPVYSTVQKYVPFPFCTVIYIAVFSFAAYLILLISMGLKKLFKKEKESKEYANAV